MDSFFMSVKKNFTHREQTIKKLLIKNLLENAREVQFELTANNSDVLELSECTNSLCTTIEAIFLHGLKDSFIRQTINVISNELDRRPEPSFWPPLLIFSHKQFIDQIQTLSQINKEIGYCRAWIRMLLNDNLLSSHIKTMRLDSSALNPYYKKSAFLRDSDMMEMAEKIMEGIEIAITFNLPFNSSLLNQWTNYPLQMAGIWVPPLKSCPISSGIDVASSLNDFSVTIPETFNNDDHPTAVIDKPSTSTASDHTTLMSYQQPIIELSNDENFDILINKIDEAIIQTENCESISIVDNDKLVTSQNQGNCILTKIGWSSSDDHHQQQQLQQEQINQNSDILSRSNSMTQSITSQKSTADRHSFNSLLARHTNKNLYSRTLDLNYIWERFENSLGISPFSQADSDEQKEEGVKEIDENKLQDIDFEVIDLNLHQQFGIDDLHLIVEQSCCLAHEYGLSNQGYTCKSCSHPLGIGFSAPQVCAFSGYYYCDQCMCTKLYVIPSKIIYNWDFRRYPVSIKAGKFLDDFQMQPFIDLKILNPDIYQAANDMLQLQTLRIQLNFIRAYLFTCCESIIEKFQKQLWSKEYLYEYIHRYSIADLCSIPKGNLIQLLKKTVQFGHDHILACRLCSQKGFICEICNNPKVLYPFNVENTFRCDSCGAVFHDTCMNSSQNCPKCERKRKREDFPLLDAVHTKN